MMQQFHAKGNTQEKWKYVHTKSCTQMLKAALFKTAKKVNPKIH